jgi:hypothetical protein
LRHKPVRADYLDSVVWDHIIGMIADPHLIRSEIDKRLDRARTSDPATRQRSRLELALAKATETITRMIEASRTRRARPRSAHRSRLGRSRKAGQHRPSGVWSSAACTVPDRVGALKGSCRRSMRFSVIDWYSAPIGTSTSPLC